MIVREHHYYCKKCKKGQFFEVDKPFTTKCPMCNEEMEYVGTNDYDT